MKHQYSLIILTIILIVNYNPNYKLGCWAITKTPRSLSRTRHHFDNHHQHYYQYRHHDLHCPHLISHLCHHHHHYRHYHSHHPRPSNIIIIFTVPTITIVIVSKIWRKKAGVLRLLWLEQQWQDQLRISAGDFAFNLSNKNLNEGTGNVFAKCFHI